MMLRNGKIVYTTTQMKIYATMYGRNQTYNLSPRDFLNIQEHTLYLENCFVLRGKQTLANLHQQKATFNKTDAQYLEMLMGFARIYQAGDCRPPATPCSREGGFIGVPASWTHSVHMRRSRNWR